MLTTPCCNPLPTGFSDCVRDSVVSTFACIIGEDPLRESGPPDAAFDGMMGVISFVGTRPWSLLLGLPRSTAEKFAVRFVGFEMDFEGADMVDTVGELANIIAGDVTARLEGIDMHVQMGMPSVARGSHLEIALPDSVESFFQGFSTSDGPFWIRVATPRSDGSGVRRHLCPACGHEV